jgi:PIN domain nuclease of toxin-antitoxin system
MRKRRNGASEAPARFPYAYWWHRGDPALSAVARAAVADSQNEKYVSAITAWELITKFRSGKQPEFAGIAADVAAVVAAHGFIQLPITVGHAQAASDLPPFHKDPMDRFLIGQAIVEDMTIVTIDRAFSDYSVKLWW